METQPINSTTIKSVTYNELDQICQINFLDGGVYWYFGVPQDIYDDFLKAKSKGQYLTQIIKPRYQVQKIG
jgi:hypothetical protein